ncbi:hypothetical protein CCACVL1_09749 [Corchorus capsularis]|uniref:Uncharacterized protein n=1 Tax=Corchorus capsularis TaxID=210143 RepID=A0A1R3IUB7_COCAP|nr:hypothetical protein CCACVL1_09749 [Corchorus capsularis]
MGRQALSKNRSPNLKIITGTRRIR